MLSCSSVVQSSINGYILSTKTIEIWYIFFNIFLLVLFIVPADLQWLNTLVHVPQMLNTSWNKQTNQRLQWKWKTLCHIFHDLFYILNIAKRKNPNKLLFEEILYTTPLFKNRSHFNKNNKYFRWNMVVCMFDVCVHRAKMFNYTTYTRIWEIDFIEVLMIKINGFKHFIFRNQKEQK